MKDAASSAGIWETTGQDWRKAATIPFLARLYRTYVTLGELQPGRQWLPLRIARNGSSFMQLIQVPDQVQSEADIQCVLHQISSDPSIPRFGFLLGVLQGDAGKGMNLYVEGNHRIPSLNLLLLLSKSHAANDRFASYTSMCCKTLGFEMHRISDGKSSSLQLKSKVKASNYRWRSERSPLFAWMFVACLGLRLGETTTQTPVRMRWFLGTSREFRIAFLQGLAESDGSASYSGYARITSWPSADFVAELVRSLGATCSIALKRGRLSDVAITIDQAAMIRLFNEEIASERYHRMRSMVEGQRLRTWPSYIVDLVKDLSKTTKAPEITRRIIEEHHIFIRSGSISRYLRKHRTEPPPPF